MILLTIENITAYAALVCSLVIPAVVMLFEHIILPWWDRRSKQQEKREAKEKERQQKLDNRIETIISNIMDKRTEENRPKTKKMLEDLLKQNQQEYSKMIEEKINVAVNKLEEKIDLSNQGTCSSLRNQLKITYYEAKKRGYKTIIDAHNFDEMYDAYIKLGGNSFVKSQIKPDWDSLPIKDHK